MKELLILLSLGNNKKKVRNKLNILPDPKLFTTLGLNEPEVPPPEIKAFGLNELPPELLETKEIM